VVSSIPSLSSAGLDLERGIGNSSGAASAPPSTSEDPPGDPRTRWRGKEQRARGDISHVPRRPSGMACAAWSSMSSDRTDRAPSVRIWPTTTALTRTFRRELPSQDPGHLVQPGLRRSVRDHATDRLLARPRGDVHHHAPSRGLHHVRDREARQQEGARQVEAHDLLERSLTHLQRGFGNDPPALLTSTSRRPKRPTVAATSSSSWSDSITSQRTARASRPRSRTLAAGVIDRGLRARGDHHVAPASASASAMSSPML